MVKVSKVGKEIYMKDNTNSVKNMDKVNLFGQMVLNMKVICLRMIYKEKELINGLMVKNMRATGLLIKCTVKVFLYGEMENHIKVSFLRVKRKDMENSNGEMTRYIQDTGKMGHNMEKE